MVWDIRLISMYPYDCSYANLKYEVEFSWRKCEVLGSSASARDESACQARRQVGTPAPPSSRWGGMLGKRKYAAARDSICACDDPGPARAATCGPRFSVLPSRTDCICMRVCARRYLHGRLDRYIYNIRARTYRPNYTLYLYECCKGQRNNADRSSS
jgi:hypothetical protein